MSIFLLYDYTLIIEGLLSVAGEGLNHHQLLHALVLFVVIIAHLVGAVTTEVSELPHVLQFIDWLDQHYHLQAVVYDPKLLE